MSAAAKLGHLKRYSRFELVFPVPGSEEAV
jgi:hypothetical protein